MDARRGRPGSCPGEAAPAAGLALVTCDPLVYTDRGRQQHAQLIAAHPDREFITLADDQALM